MRATLTPLPNETQPAFAVRFHESMRGAIPQTDLRNQAMFDAWADRQAGDPLTQRAAKSFPPEQYRRVARVPVFAEHETTEGPAKTPVKYSRDDLAAMVTANNRRIADTGSFAPISDGHTPTKAERAQGKPNPEVLGYSGPFYLGMIGNENPRYAIFCDEHHRNDRFDRTRNMPYRSPEVWLESRMEDRFFSPIAALGTETPRLDLGMAQYERDGETHEVARYSAAAFPSASNVTINTTDYAAGPQNEDNDMTENMSGATLGDADVQQIVGAIFESAPFQWLLEKMQEENGEDAAAPTEDLPDAIDSEPGDAPPQPTDAAGGAEAFATKTAPPAATPQPAPQPPAAPDPTADMADDERAEYSALSPDGRAGYMKARQRYMAGPTAHYSRTADDVVAQRVLRENYSRLKAENYKLRDEVEKQRNRARAADRRSRYSKLHEQGYQFDIDKEMNRTESFSDDQFESHLTTIAENYARVPLGTGMIPVDESPVLTDRATEDRQREHYARQARDVALAENIPYEVALARVKANAT